MIVTESTQADLENKVLIIGDLLIDRTFYVDVPKLSPEAPVPVAMLTGDAVDTPGGAGLAVAFAAVAKIPTIFGTYTCPDNAIWIFREYNIPVIYPQTRSKNVNSIKIRYIDNERHYHLLRVDSDKIINPPFNSPGEEEEWFSRLEKVIQTQKIGIMAILDYRKGLLSSDRSQQLIQIAHKNKIPVYIDSRCQNLSKFKGADVLKLNSSEFKAAIKNLNIEDNIKYHHDIFTAKLGIKHFIETKGAEGVTARYEPEPYGMTLSYQPNITKYKGSPDVTGCGDVFDVTFCYQWGINKVDFYEAIQIAVDTATKFAYQPIGERLKCQN